MMMIIERVDLYAGPSARLLGEVLRAAALDGRVVRGTETQVSLVTVRQVTII